MRRSLRCLVFFSGCLTPTLSRAGIPYYPDHVPAATLVVPFFETAVDPATKPDDTLLAVANRVNSACIIHYTVWSRHGRAVFGGNVNLAGLGQWSASMRDLISPQPGLVKGALVVEGALYRGFVTVDLVGSATALDPTAPGYPFSDANILQGFVYYTRLSKGSANGMSMIPIETFQGGGFRQFYGNGDRRERIDGAARMCNTDWVLEHDGFCAPFGNKLILENRLFGSTPLNGSTRVVVFMWSLYFPDTEGPSDYCTDHADNPGCVAYGTTYVSRIFNESGAPPIFEAIQLPYVVNVFDYTLPFSGTIRYENIPDYAQVPYTFAFNSASPNSNPNLSWDAIFEGNIILP